MIRDLRFLLNTFEPRDRALLWFYVPAQFLVSLTDLVGIAVVLPIMQVVLGASLEDGYLAIIYDVLGQPGRTEFVVIMAIAMVATFLVKAVAALWLQWWSGGYVMRLQVATSRRLLTSYLTEDYLSHKKRSVAELARIVDGSVNDALVKVLGGALQLISSSLSIFTVLVLLVIVEPVVTLGALIFFGAAVFVTQRALGRRNVEAGRRANHAAWMKSRALFDAMGGYREVRVHNAREFFVDRFTRENITAASASRSAMFFQVVPRYTLEVLSIVGIAALLIYVTLSSTTENTMPVLALFVAATVRILPTLVALTSQLGLVRNGEAGLNLVADELRALEARGGIPDAQPILEARPRDRVQPLEIRNVTFRYPESDRDVLRNVRIRVPAGTSLALTGHSGSGKTTLVDIVLGLIEPDEGRIMYGPDAIQDLHRQWHEIVAYVPQDVYLVDDSIEANIAFGIDEADVDEELMRHVVRQAQLDVLIDDLPDGLSTRVGARGMRLSGGQRQRLGIARALYRRPEVIVFDEATSALDNETEHKIADTINSLRGSVTTILVAHRLSTVRAVDQLAYLRDGLVESIGTFEQVERESAQFARLVALGRLDGDTEISDSDSLEN